VSPFRKGSVLFIALWSLCLLSIFAVYLGLGVRQKITFVDRINSRSSLRLIAEAGVKQAIAELRKKEPAEYDALNEAWSNNPGIFKQVSVGYGEFNVCYDYLDYKSGKLQTRFGLLDEERKLNINEEDLNTIQRLIVVVTGLEEIEAQNLAAAIVDWRDSDSALSIPSGSAEDRYYRNLSVPYEAKDADYEVLDELLLVRGMSQKILDKLKNYISIHSSGEVNINTASAEVLFALNLGSELIDKIISFRRGKDGVEATEDDNIFSSPSNIVEELNRFSELSDTESSKLSSLISSGKISTNSNNFMVRSIAYLDEQKSEIVCTFDREGKILSWKEE
jgi:general secretion pathway protein K